MPVQEWRINTREAYAGEQYGLATTNSQRLTYNAEAEQHNWGLAVVQGTKDTQCKVGHNKGEILGVTMRQLNLESATRPGNGTVKIPEGWPVGVMISGPIMVRLETAIDSAEIGISVQGTWGKADGSVYTAATNVKALRFPAAAGDVIPVMINVVPGTTPPAAGGGE